MRFRYPFPFALFFGFFFLASMFVSGTMLILGIHFVPSAVIALIGFFSLYMVYEATQSIYMDDDGVALCSIFGEIRRLQWVEITDIESTSFLAPGLKVLDGEGRGIEISRFLWGYSKAVKLLQDYMTQPADREKASEAQPLQTVYESYDFVFRATGGRWLLILILVFLSGYMMFAGMQTGNVVAYILAVALALAITFGYLFIYLSEPVLVVTRKDILFIRFRWGFLRDPIKAHYKFVQDIGLGATRGLDLFPKDVVVTFGNGEKVKIYGFASPSPDIAARLTAWMQNCRAEASARRGDGEKSPSYADLGARLIPYD